jgi:hypothetical protein
MTRAAAGEIENPELTRLERWILRQQLDDARRVGALLQLVEDEHLVCFRVVDAGLACGNTFPGHDHGLHALEEVVTLIHTGCRRDHDATGGHVDRDH